MSQPRPKVSESISWRLQINLLWTHSGDSMCKSFLNINRYSPLLWSNSQKFFRSVFKNTLFLFSHKVTRHSAVFCEVYIYCYFQYLDLFLNNYIIVVVLSLQCETKIKMNFYYNIASVFPFFKRGMGAYEQVFQIFIDIFILQRIKWSSR